jgi:hypothetical protein
MTPAKSAPISFAGSNLTRPRHVCAFFNSDDDAYRVLGPFIREGFDCCQKAIHLINPDQREAHLNRLRCEGIDTDAAEKSGQLEIKTTVDAYLKDGRFDKHRMLETFKSLASGNASGPYPLSRIVCQMDWAADDRPHLLDLIEFEARVNDVWSRHDDVVICVYDLAKFGGETVVDMLRTHPFVVIGGVLQENPFYITPEKFLGELRARSTARNQQRGSER